MRYSTDILAKNLTPVGIRSQILIAIESRYALGDYEPVNLRRQLKTMSRGERAVVLTWIFFNQIYNSGFVMFFLEIGADLAHDTAEAHELVGMPKSAAIIRKAIAAAAIPHPIPAGYDYTAGDGEDRDAALLALDREYYASADGHVEERVVEYVRKHPEEFA